MVFRTFEQLFLQALPKKRRVAVAGSHDIEVLKTADALSAQFDFLLFGDPEPTKELAQKAGINLSAFSQFKTDGAECAHAAADAVCRGHADVLMKGMCKTPDFLRAVLNCEQKPEGLLSHLAVFEAPAYGRLMFVTDGGMNVLPDYEKKHLILENALTALKKLGYISPNVALLAASESVNSKVGATADAAQIIRCPPPDCIIEGPLALDVALSAAAAAAKGIESKIAGQTDLFLVPNIEAGNILGKSLIYLAGAKMAGVILGAHFPIVLTSRAESMQGKISSLRLACML